MREIKQTKLTSKHQTTLPKEVCDLLQLKAGDRVAFEILAKQGLVIIRKAVPFDKEYARALASTLSEWDSKEDEYAFKDLQNI